MGSAVNIKSNLEVRCLSVRCLPCLPLAELWEVPTAGVSPCGVPAGPRPWGDPRLALCVAAFGRWSRCWRAGKGNQVCLLCPVLASSYPSLRCRGMSEGPVGGLRLPLPWVALVVLGKMFLSGVLSSWKAGGESWRTSPVGGEVSVRTQCGAVGCEMPTGLHQWSVLLGWLARHLYLIFNREIIPSFSLLNSLLATVGTWKKKVKNNQKKA